jgi:hypothetical protein
MLSHNDWDYIENVDIDTVPWNRLATAYGRADELPELLMGVVEGDASFVEQVLEQIEHQSTLWHSTPFALIFLNRIYIDSEDIEVLTALSDAFTVIVEAAKEQFENFAMPYPPSLGELLDDDYLMQEIEDLDEEEEADELYWEEGGPSSELFAAFYIYSFEIIKNNMERIKELAKSSDADLAEAASDLAELVEGCEYSHEENE